MKNKIKSLIISMMMAVVLTSCNEDEETIDISGVKFKNSTIELVESSSYNLDDYLEISGADASQAQITFTSDDSDIVNIDGKMFNAIKVGTTQLNVMESHSGLTAIVDVNVIAKVVSVTGISLDKETAEMKVGETLQLIATIAPTDATEKGLTWSVALPEAKTNEAVEEIATVSETGLVTAKSAGKVVVTAKSSDGNFTANATMTITNIAVTSIKITPDPIVILGNEEVQLTATIAPENATIKTVTWSIAFNKGVRANKGDVNDFASIDANTGVIKGKQAVNGWIDAIATSTDGGIVAKVPITVTYVAATSVTLAPSTVKLNPGETQQMTATVFPENANNQDITWSIVEHNEVCRLQPEAETKATPPVSDYVTVDENGLVTGLAYYNNSYCNLKVTATLADGPKDDVTVVVNPILANSVTIDQGNEVIELQIGASLSLTTTVLPENTTDKNITWSLGEASPRSLISLFSINIDANGVVTTNRTGHTRVTATNTESGKTDFIDIKVIVSP